LHNSSILGGIDDKHTRISCSTDKSRSRFLFLIFVSAEDPSSQRYVVENDNNIFIAISVIIGYVQCTRTAQNAAYRVDDRRGFSFRLDDLE